MAVVRKDVRRNMKATVGFTAYSVGLLLVTALLIVAAVSGWVEDTFWCWMGAFVLGVSGVAVLVQGVARGEMMAMAECPSCNASMTGLSLRQRNDHVLCSGCTTFVEGNDGQIWSTSEETIAEHAVFGCYLPDEFKWSGGCVVCAQEATRTVKTDTRVTNLASSAVKSAAATAVGALVGVGMLVSSGTRIEVSVPHCDAHDDGARLENGVDGVMILFRSYPYWRQFRALNGVKAADAKAIAKDEEEAEAA